jgi:hypothetical protein
LAAEHTRLEQLAGSWSGDETLYANGDDPGGAARSQVDARMVLGGAFLMTQYTAEREGFLPYSGIGITGWDDKSRCYTLHWFDALGRCSALPATGSFVGNVLKLEEAEPGGRIRYLYVLEGPDHYLFRIERTQADASWKPLMQGSYQRVTT